MGRRQSLSTLKCLHLDPGSLTHEAKLLPAAHSKRQRGLGRRPFELRDFIFFHFSFFPFLFLLNVHIFSSGVFFNFFSFLGEDEFLIFL